VFLLMRASGDPTQLLLPLDASDAERAAFREKIGLDQPLPVQYVRFVADGLRGDFGRSLQYRRPALELVLERYPSTFQLALAVTIVGLIVGLILGVLAAIGAGGIMDRIALGVSMLGQSIPDFWLGLILILVFAVTLGVLPTSGKEGLQSFVLPTLTLSFGFVAQIILIVRSGMLEVLREDYIRTARAKGLSELAVIIRHGLRNTLIPLVTFVGLVFSLLLGGAVIVETVFSWPGVGQLSVNAIFARDYPVVQVCVLGLALGVVLVNLLVDLCYGMLDPRVRRS
jgi:ABC-type dipeptide/oligopeptide/nickel transport system permease component